MPLSRQTILTRQQTLIPMLTAGGWSKDDAYDIACCAASAAERGEAYVVKMTQGMLSGTLTVNLSGNSIEMKTFLTIE